MPSNRSRRHRKSHRFTKKKPKSNEEKPHVPQPNETIKPGSDFYSYVNSKWQRHVNMPRYLSSYGVSEEIEDIVNAELMDILLESKKEVETKPEKNIPYTTYLLGTLTESILNSRVQDRNVNFLRGFIAQLNCARDMKDIGNTIGDFIKHRITTLFIVSVLPMDVSSSSLKLAILPGKLSLPDNSYYLQKTTYNTRVLNAYSRLLQMLSEDFNMPHLESILPIEQMAAYALQVSNQDTEVLMSGATIQKKYSHIPFESICETMLGWTPAKIKKHDFLIVSKHWLSSVNKWFKTLDLATWKRWLAVSCLFYFLPLLPPPYDDMDFELFGKRLRGQSEKVPQHRLALQTCKTWLTATLGKAYIERHVPFSLKKEAKMLAEEIKKVAEERAGATSWLDDSTRKLAKSKVESIYLGIAYPEKQQKDDKTILHPERFIENVLTLAKLDFEDDMEKMNTKLNPETWDDPVFAVNAYYYNSGNRLILPSGILRWPFYKSTASDGWNFGGLGATIGHEICHAFDNDGKDYDKEGNLNPWWSKAERARYMKKTKALINLYSNTSYFGKPLNGALTLSENIADLGGVDIALSALKKRLEKRGVSKEVYKKEICDFFISFAVSWRTKEKRQKAMQSLFMDVHAPPLARVNNIVCQFDEWYECFDVKPGDALYKAPQERIRIF